MKKKLLTGLAVVAAVIGVKAGRRRRITMPTHRRKQNVIQRLDYYHQDNWNFESGDSQSPINIPTADLIEFKEPGQLQLEYVPRVTQVEDNGHSIQAECTGKAILNQRIFQLKQFHFHASSEHTVDGRYYPMEIHFVHQSEAGRLGVVAAFFEAGKFNPAFQQILDKIVANEKNEVTFDVDLFQMLPANLNYYHYLGSLTTPPLSENVEWYVLEEPVQIAAEQIAAFRQFYAYNNRIIQPRNQRPILHCCVKREI